MYKRVESQRNNARPSKCSLQQQGAKQEVSRNHQEKLPSSAVQSAPQQREKLQSSAPQSALRYQGKTQDGRPD